MKRRLRWTAVILAAAVVIAVAIISSTYTSPMVACASDEWSRGFAIGETAINRPITLQFAPDAGVLLAWSNMDGRLELAHIGADGSLLFDRVLDLGSDRARTPQLMVDSAGTIHLVWREEEHPYHTVRYARLDPDGTPIDQQIISEPVRETFVDTPRLLIDYAGNAHIVWTDRDGLQWATVDAAGALIREPTLIAAGGRSPTAQIDNTGRFHLAWRLQTSANDYEIHYATLDPQSGALTAPEITAQIFSRIGQAIEGPELGLEADFAYVFWTIQDSRAAGSVSQYASFPIGSAAQSQTYEMPLRLGRNPGAIYPVVGQQTPLLLTTNAETTSLSNYETKVQALVMGFASAEGATRVTESVITGSGSASVRPVAARDANSNLHMAWLETAGFRRYRVVYASTSPQVMETYNALTLWDVLNPVAGKSLDLVTMTILTVVPLMLLWFVVPMLGLVVYHVISGEELLDVTRTRLALAAALVIEVLLIWAFPPRITSASPSLRWAAPLATSTLAAAAMLYFLRRRGFSSSSPLFTAFFVFTSTNMLAQMLIYFLSA